MNRYRIAIWVLLALGLASLGCKKEEPMPTPPAKIDKPAPGTTGASAADPTATAIARLDGVKQLISDKKLDDADKALKSVEADKDKLPEGVRGQVAALRKSLDTARAAAKAIDSGPKPPDVNVAVPDK